MIWFEPVRKTEALCPAARRKEAALWHVRHGWYYHAWEYPAGRIVGGFYVTLLAGYGGILHFDVYDPSLAGRPGTILAGFRKAIRMVNPCFDITCATIPEGSTALRRIVTRLGFVELCRFRSDGHEVCLLKYFKTPEVILSSEAHEAH